MPKITLDDQTRERLFRDGELRVEDMHGIPMVLMTVDARQRMQRVVYVDSDLTDDEMLSIAARELADPEGWGAPDMDVYDVLYGDKPTTDGNNQ